MLCAMFAATVLMHAAPGQQRLLPHLTLVGYCECVKLTWIYSLAYSLTHAFMQSPIHPYTYYFI